MRKRRRTILLTLALTLAAPLPLVAPATSFAAEPAKAKGPLDGRFFQGMTGEAGKAKGDPERFRFEDGKFDPLECHQFGFEATKYTVLKSGAAIEFEAEHKNPKGERMKWVGVVKDGELNGKMTYYDAAGKASNYWFNGKQKKEL